MKNNNEQPSKTSAMHFTPEQQQAFEAVVDGRSVCISGQAGSGKSTLLVRIIEWAHTKDKEIGVTSTTGSSAILIGGRTLHSFLGIGLGKKPAEALAADAVKKKRQTVVNLRKTKLLVVDEVSMLDEELFTKIDEYLRILRRNQKPFGGIQMIFSGDFAQIPPVNGDFCFKSDVWKEMNIEKFVFKTLIRQRDDLEFQRILEQLRWGKCTPEILKILRATSTNVFPEGIEPTTLYSKNMDVDAVNKKKYEELLATGAPSRRYATKYSDKVAAKGWGDACKIQEAIEMAVGAQVMVTHNINVEQGITNGSRGVVTGLSVSGPIVKFVSGLEIVVEPFKTECEDVEGMYVSYLPLKLAYAITSHKSQGQTLDCVRMDLGPSIFEYGQAYTCISRAKSLKSICIVNVIPSSFRSHPDVLRYYGQGS